MLAAYWRSFAQLLPTGSPTAARGDHALHRHNQCKAWRTSTKAWPHAERHRGRHDGSRRVEVLAYAKVGKKRFKTLSRTKLKTVLKTVKTKARATRKPVPARVTRGGWTMLPKLPKLPKGTWTVRVRATDRAGNTSAWVGLKIKIKRR